MHSHSTNIPCLFNDDGEDINPVWIFVDPTLDPVTEEGRANEAHAQELCANLREAFQDYPPFAQPTIEERKLLVRLWQPALAQCETSLPPQWTIDLSDLLRSLVLHAPLELDAAATELERIASELRSM